MPPLRKFIRSLGLFLLRSIGSTIVDEATGEKLGKALLIPWRGRIRMIGLQVDVKPVFRLEKRLTFWKHDIGFTRQPSPDFPRETRSQSDHHP